MSPYTMSLFLDATAPGLVQNLSFGKPTVNKSGGKQIPIFNAVARSGLKMSTPMMTTWGVNRNDFDGKVSYDMSLQFPSPEYSTPETTAFLENMKQFEAELLNEAHKNSKTWFGKQHSPDVIAAFLTPTLRYSKDKATGEPDYSKQPTMRLKFSYYDGVIKSEVYDMNKEMVFPKMVPADDGSGLKPVDIMDVISKGDEVTCILQCGGVWNAAGKFGVTWRPWQIVLKPKLKLSSGVCHLFPSTSSTSVVSALSATLAHSTQVDSDEDPEDEYKAEPESSVVASTPATTDPEVPVKGKKKVRKLDEKA